MATYTQAKPAGTPTWTDLTTSDTEAARKFYHAVFGWEYDVGGPEFGGYATAKLGTHTPAGIGGPMPGAPATPAAWTLYFASHDIEADVAHVLKLGGKVLSPFMQIGEFGGMAICQDPTGAAFGFWKAGIHIGATVTEDIGSMAWCELYSPDAKRARDFYSALLGTSSNPMPGPMEYYVLQHGEQQLAGIMQIDPAWGNMHPAWLVYFSVANTDATVAVITKHGGKVMGPVDDSPFGRLAAVADPAGAQFKIVQTPSKT